MIGPIARVVYFAEMARFADLRWANEHALARTIDSLAVSAE